MGVSFDQSLGGGQVIDGLVVPAITAQALAQRGFDAVSLSQYLSTGVSAQGTSFGSMYTVTHFSTSAMQKADVDAIATYLMTDASGNLLAPAKGPEPLPIASDPALEPGRLRYMSACASCHGTQGEGIPHVAPPMRGNAALMTEDPTNLLTVILNGVQTQTFAGNERMYAMPGFADRLNADEIAVMATWVRAQWAGQAQAVTADQVHTIMNAKNR